MVTGRRALGLAAAALAALLAGCAPAPHPGTAAARPPDALAFPVVPDKFITRFSGAEGITFNGEGRLFIGADTAIWIAEPDGSVRQVADVDTHLGQAGIGQRDILAADFGPTNVFRDGPNDDGVVWRITPEGGKTVVARGIADPNAILVREDGSFLVSDDGTDEIYLVRPGGAVSVWSDAVAYPNGMALSLDGSTLYVAQIFTRLGPVEYTDVVWALPVAGGMPSGPPRVAVRTGGSGVDGLAMDRLGRVYVADNQSGRIVRFDPASGELVVIAEGMSNVASLVFGEGDFDRRALYATSTQRGGGTIWKVPVGIEGAPVVR
jgi:gluconolactonase